LNTYDMWAVFNLIHLMWLDTIPTLSFSPELKILNQNICKNFYILIENYWMDGIKICLSMHLRIGHILVDTVKKHIDGMGANLILSVKYCQK